MADPGLVDCFLAAVWLHQQVAQIVCVPGQLLPWQPSGLPLTADAALLSELIWGGMQPSASAMSADLLVGFGCGRGNGMAAC